MDRRAHSRTSSTTRNPLSVMVKYFPQSDYHLDSAKPLVRAKAIHPALATARQPAWANRLLSVTATRRVGVRGSASVSDSAAAMVWGSASALISGLQLTSCRWSPSDSRQLLTVQPEHKQDSCPAGYTCVWCENLIASPSVASHRQTQIDTRCSHRTGTLAR
jgi:hypothetical protein